MRHLLLALLLALATSACATNPVPQGYAGPLARIYDSSGLTNSVQTKNVFFIELVNGKRVTNASDMIKTNNMGLQSTVEAFGFVRDVPAGQMTTFTIVGRTQYAVPFLQMTNPTYEVKGNVDFVPKSGRAYIVRGTVTPETSSVWIEDEQTKAVIGAKIEVKNPPLKSK